MTTTPHQQATNHAQQPTLAQQLLQAKPTLLTTQQQPHGELGEPRSRPQLQRTLQRAQHATFPTSRSTKQLPLDQPQTYSPTYVLAN